MDIFVEQLVKVRRGAKEFLIMFGVSAAALLILGAVIWFATTFAPLVLLLLGFGWWWVAKMQVNEYEYSVTNGDIDIDRIRGRSNRLRLVSVRGEKVESLSRCKVGDNFSRYDRVVYCHANDKDPETPLWCFTYQSKKNGHTAVIFQPEERVLKAFMEGLPYLVRREAEKELAAAGLSEE